MTAEAATPADSADTPETPDTLDTLDNRRKQLRFRAWHRGTREADLLIGSFADRNLPRFDADQVERFAALLEVSDPDLYNWMTGREPVPAEYDHDVMTALKAHRFADAG